jgi:hypothetical protein
MFTPARYIVLDDEPAELATLVDALHVLGAPCVGVRFDPLGLPSPELFAGVRILFSDLHLVKAQPAGVQHYNTLASLIDRCVPDQHGPYLLVLWTSHEHERAALTARLEELLPPSKRPIAVLALDKTRFRNAGVWNADALRQEIREQIICMPQLQALLAWERDVLAAANETLAIIGGLVSDAQRGIGTYPAGLDNVLSLLAVAALGEENALKDRKGAVAAAMAPLLSDRILNRPSGSEDEELWERAVTFQQPAQLTPPQKARMNTMLHLAIPPAESVSRLDWGAVIPLDDAKLADNAMLAKFGMTAADLREHEFKLKQSRRTEGRIVVIRGGANCDQAQAQSGPIPLMLGLLVPTGALATDRKRSPAVHTCEEKFALQSYAEPATLLVHARFVTTVVPEELATFSEPTMRLREQLLAGILVHVGAHLMRPGTIRF